MDRTHLLVIDPQNDFCDLPADRIPSGNAPALPVQGAHADLLRLSSWLDAHARSIDAITVTMDHHHRLDIAHPGFWRVPAGTAPSPFTPVTAADLESGRIATARSENTGRALAYLRALEQTGRFAHMIWPVHCQIGTWGQCVHADLQASLDRWEDGTDRSVRWVLKGENPWTEHYSALRAEIPDPDDPATDLNRDLLDHLHGFGRILVAGEAGSHCVRATVEHLLENWRAPADRIVLVSDAMSPVAGFEAAQETFLREAAGRGARILPLARVPE